MAPRSNVAELPGSELDTAKMPGHWLLARLGKRVLRPGGLALTQQILDGLSITADDRVVEFAPGLGGTGRMILEKAPRSYVGVDATRRRSSGATRHLPQQQNVSMTLGRADETSLPTECASIVLGEAMLSMNTQEHKQRIVAEAFRLLRPGGRYGIHELCIVPDDMPSDEKQEIDRALSSVIHVGARPLPTREWCELLEAAGFRIARIGHAPMHLLRPQRIIQDEGLWGALRLASNVLRNGQARRRVMAMRRVFEQYHDNLSAIFVIAAKDRA